MGRKHEAKALVGADGTYPVWVVVEAATGEVVCDGIRGPTIGEQRERAEIIAAALSGGAA